MQVTNAALISWVEIEDLFGAYSYHLDFFGVNEPDSRGRRLTLLYGNNGSGKTTILKLLWDTLSADTSKGHRERIAKTPFRSLVIRLSMGDTIKVTKNDGLTGSFSITVDGETEVRQAYMVTAAGVTAVPDSLLGENAESNERELRLRLIRARMQRPVEEYKDGSDKFAAYLKELGAVPYMLADDRQIYGDAIDSSTREEEWVIVEDDDDPSAESAKGVAAELTQAIERVDALVKDQVIKGGQQGSRSSNSVYLGILGRVANTEASRKEVTKDELIGKIEEVAERTQVYSRYGLLPRINKDQFIDAVRAVPDSELGVAEAVLDPFLSSQSARLDALNGVFALVQTFTNEMNRFFGNSGKKVTYQTFRGIQVRSAGNNRLSPEQLSSGERQILLLLLNTILARENTKLFLIDEPEISLNVKWQRQLMDALLACTEGSAVQFVVATHSIEVITGHRASLARMVPKK
ncbi:AAA family ATPase [Streptomyces sp. NPDC051987]|uniref:AAA family ATPase n=1 Tax=Streptomyces sp. NPDC051987 TaxID=3155808 RepID=UPI0034313C4D